MLRGTGSIMHAVVHSSTTTCMQGGVLQGQMFMCPAREHQPAAVVMTVCITGLTLTSCRLRASTEKDCPSFS